MKAPARHSYAQIVHALEQSYTLTQAAEGLYKGTRKAMAWTHLRRECERLEIGPRKAKAFLKRKDAADDDGTGGLSFVQRLETFRGYLRDQTLAHNVPCSSGESYGIDELPALFKQSKIANK